MLRKVRSSLLVCSLLLLSLSAKAVTLIPVPISEDYPLRLGVAVKESNSFSPSSLRHLGGVAGLAYGFGGGFEGGFQVRSGINSDRLFQSGSTSNWSLGGDGMLRYLGSVTEIFFLGLQGRVGYDYAFDRANITDASTVTAGVAVPFGLTFSEAFSLYLMPEIEFGNRKATDTSVFGSLVGIAGAVGGYFQFGSVAIYAEVRPKASDLSDTANSFGMDAQLGLAFDL